MYCIQHCIICRPSVSTVLEDAGIELRTVATPSHQSYLVGTETANELTPYIFLTQDWSGALAAKLPGRCRNCQWANALHFLYTGLVRRPRSKATWCRSASWQRPPLPDVTQSIPDMDSSPRMWSLRSCASSAALYSWDPPPPPLGEEVNIKYFWFHGVTKAVFMIQSFVIRISVSLSPDFS